MGCFLQPPKTDKKKDVGKAKAKDPANKAGGKAKKKVTTVS